MGLVLGWRDDERDRVAQFHNVVHKNFDVIDPGGLEFDLAEEGHVRGVERGILEGEFHFAFSQNAGLVGSDQSNGFGEITHTCGPAVKEAKPESDHWNMGNADQVHHADEEKVSGDLLADFFAEERALEVGEDAGGVHF